MLELLFFSMDTGLQPSPPLFNSLVNDTLTHIGSHVLQLLFKFPKITNGLAVNTFL